MIEEFLRNYAWELAASCVLLLSCLLVCMLFSRLFPGKESNRRKSRWIVRIALLLLGLDLLVDIWDERSDWAGKISKYTNYLPGYDTILYLAGAALFCYLIYVWILRTTGNVPSEDLTTRHKIRRIATWGSTGSFVVIAVIILLARNGWSNAGTFLGLVGAGLALSMQETLLCIAGWLHIIINRAYDIGDRVEINGQKGDVINITPTHTQLLEVGNWSYGEQSTGRILTIPNSTSFRNSVHNYTCGFPFIWDEMAITVTFESNWKRARGIILEQALEKSAQIEAEVMRNITKMQERFAINYRHLTPAIYTSIQDSGVRLSLRFLSPARARRQREHEISEGILQAFDLADDIELAYPTSRIFRRNEEQEPYQKVYSSPGQEDELFTPQDLRP